MGLDQWLYKIKELPAEECARLNGTHTDNFPDNVLWFEAKNVENYDNAGMVADIFPCLTKINALSTFYDIEKMKADNGIPENARITGQCYGGNGENTFSFRWSTSTGDRHKTVTFGSDEYLIEKERPVYVCYYSEQKYWRKDYDVQEVVYANYVAPDDSGKGIENCGYYVMDDYILGIIAPELKGEEDIFYHEWY